MLTVQILISLLFVALLFFASVQDIRSRQLSLPAAWSLIGLTVLAIISRSWWYVFGFYVFFMIFSYFLYEKPTLQVVAAVGGIVFALLLLGKDVEQSSVILIMSTLWWFAFLQKERGESDYNVLFTALAVMGVSAFFIFIAISLLVFIALYIYQLISQKSGRTLNLPEIVYSLYHLLSGIKTDPHAETLSFADGDKRVPIPMIPLLGISSILGFLVWGAINQSYDLFIGLFGLAFWSISFAYLRKRSGPISADHNIF